MDLMIKLVSRVVKLKYVKNTILRDILDFYSEWKLYNNSPYKERKYS